MTAMRWMMGTMLVLLTQAGWAANRPSGYVTICTEGKTCSVATSTNVAFGRADKFFYKVLVGSFVCNEATFGGKTAGGVNECSVPSGGSTSSAASSSMSSASSSKSSSSSSVTASSSSSSNSSSSSSKSSSSSSSGGGTTGTRPQLGDAVAANYDVAQFLAKAGPLTALVTDNWSPRTTVIQTPASPAYVVAKSGGTHTTVQAAVTAIAASGVTTRQYIKVMPGTYNELVIVPLGTTITLYGGGADPSQTVIALPTAAKLTGAQFAAMANPGGAVFTSSTPTAIKSVYDACASKSGSIGTTCSSLFVVTANNFEMTNVTVQNTYDEGGGESQAVALMVVGDRNLFNKVRLLGNQDTLYVKTTALDVVARSYFGNSYIEGDTDFIFGRGTAVFDACTIYFTRVRKSSSTIAAPSTATSNPYGFLFTQSIFNADAGGATISFARQWPESSSNGGTIGKVIVRESTVSAFIKNPPWADWSSSNPAQYGTATNPYLAEYKNVGPGAAQ
ncbi:MAG TPA: pectinesterase family protein [Rhodocyclaceae bacterium]|nr:pectinesterase family protein [Rhodocyclaceae bacterium]